MTYQSKEFHYSFDVPSGWEEIPKQLLDEHSEMMSRLTNTKKIDYETGFQLAGKKIVEPPNILIPILLQYGRELPSNALEQLYEKFTSTEFSSAVEKKMESLPDFLSNLSFEFDSLYLDKKRKMIVMSVKVKTNYSGNNLQTLVVHFVGKRTIIQIGLVVPESEYHKYLPVFETIINSFKFDEPLKSKNLQERMIDKTISNIIVGLIIGIIVLVSVGISNWIKKKTGQNNKPKFKTREDYEK